MQHSWGVRGYVFRRRYDKFMDAFNHISVNINAIYKQLTQSTTHPLGGTAYLSLESEDEPYLHGIKYTAMPPTKRFRDMEQLSGGEKTVAALALLFAIHRYDGMRVSVVGMVGCYLCVLAELTRDWSGFWRGVEGWRCVICLL
jgi:DNA repair exonuclease SbcCD ATPase subunit